MRNYFSKIALAAGFALALAFTFSCSSDDGEDNSTTPSSNSSPSLPSSSSVAAISSSSSIVVGTQYYDVMLGNWSASCPSLNDYPELLNNVIALNDSFISTLQTCLINSESYLGNTSSQVSSFLATNGLSGFANDFNLRIAASPYNTAFLIYVNASNYYRVLIIGYSLNVNLSSSSSNQTPLEGFCDYVFTAVLGTTSGGSGNSAACRAALKRILLQYPDCVNSDSYRQQCK